MDNVAAVSLAVTFAVVVVMGYLSYRTIQRFLHNDARVTRSHQVLEAIQSVLSDLRDAETGQRGFLLTGSPAYLQPYESGRRLAQSDLARLENLIRDEPDEQAAVKRLDALAQAKLRELALTLQILNSRGRSSALDVVRTGEGERLMRQISRVAAEMRIHERNLLTQRTQAAEDAARQARDATIAGTIVAAAMIALALIFVARYIRQRVSAEADNVRLSALAKETASRQRTFLRDVLSSVTEGRLRFCETAAELPAKTQPVCGHIRLDESGGLAELRSYALEASQACGITRDRGYDLITSASEAGMNAISHAGGGEAQVCTDGSERVQVWIEDHGTGISLEQLPHATLERGYSTGGTLGHGFYMMLQMVDQVYLLTGPTGTVVVLEQFQKVAPRGWIEVQMANDPPVLPMTPIPN